MPSENTLARVVRALILEIKIEAAKFSPGQSLESARSEYRNTLALIMLEYLESDRPITSFRNEYRRATNDAFIIASVAGWADGGESGPLPESLVAWNNAQIDAQIGYIEGVFDQLKELRKGDRAEWSAFVGARADGYAASLVGIYSRAKMEAEKKELGRWTLGPTEHCDTCQGLSGQTHPLQWFIENRFIPQQNGSPTLECGGWNCQCTIRDPETGKVLIP